MRSNRMFWAIILIGLGFLFLANNLGLMSLNVWNYFWPGFLILLGIWFLVGTTKGKSDLVMESGSIDLDGATRASVVIKHGAGRLAVSGSADTGKLTSGSFANGLESRVTRDGDHMNVVMQPQTPPFPEVIFPWNWISGRGFEWDFAFAKDIPLSLVFEIGAVDAHLDLSQNLVKDLTLKTGASSTNLNLPSSAGMTRLKIESGAASVKIQIPEGVAARVESQSGLASILVDQKRFPKQNGIYQSADYETADNKVEIRIETGLGSVEIY